MPIPTLDPEAIGDGIERVRHVARLQGHRQQQRVEHGLVEAHADLLLLEPEKLHVEGGIVGNQHRVANEGVKAA